jgi:hypothetical protein
VSLTVRRAVLLPIMLVAMLLTSSKCDIGCELPGPDDDWRVSTLR